MYFCTIPPDLSQYLLQQLRKVNLCLLIQEDAFAIIQLAASKQ